MRLLAWVAILGAVVTGGWWYIQGARHNHEVTLLQQQLGSFIVPPVSYQGNTYIVEQGRVVGTTTPEVLPILRIAYASVVSRLDPQYGIEGTDPAVFEKSVTDLEDFQTALVDMYPPNQAIYIAQLFPVDFLHTLAKAERARLTLVEHPSDTAVAEYSALLQEVVQKNHEYVGDMISFLRAQGSNTKGTLAFFDGETTLDDYVARVEDYQHSLDDTARRVEERTECFAYVGGGCTMLTDAFARLTAPATSTLVASTLPPQVAADRELLAAFFARTATTTRVGPVVALAQSPCFSQFLPVYYLSAEDAASGAYSLSFLNDLYFYATAAHAADARIPAALKAAVPYVNQSVANLYMCLSSGHDLVHSLTLDTLSRILHPKQKIAVLSESDSMSEVANISAQLAGGELALAVQAGTSTVLADERMLGMVRQQSPRFDAVLHDVIFNEDAISSYASQDTRLPLATLFLARSYMPLLLLSYNQSVAPAPLVLADGHAYDISRFGLVSLSSLAPAYSSSQMLNTMLKGYAVQHPNN